MSELGNFCITELKLAEGADYDGLAQNRSDALSYYWNKARGDEEAGVTQAQSSDLADMVNAMLAQIMPAFCNETLVEFEPNDEQDEQQAADETDIVSDVVINKNNGYHLFLSTIKDALVLRNCVARVDVDEREIVTENEHEAQDATDVADILSDSSQGVGELLSHNGGIARIRRTRKVRRLVVNPVLPENFRVRANWRSIYLDECPFIAERMIDTRESFVAMGLPKKAIYDLPELTQLPSDNLQRNRGNSGELNSTDAGQQYVEVWCAYVLFKNQRKRVYFNEQTSTELKSEDAEFQPYACGTPFVVPGRWTGESLFDRLKSVQDVKTHFLRQWIENVKRAVRTGWIAAKGADIETLKNARAGMIAREDQPGLIRPLPFTDVGPSIGAALEYMDKVRTERGGAGLDMQQAELQIAGDTAHGIERQYSAKEQLSAMITKTLAETFIRSLYMLVHKTLRTQFAGEQIRARINGKWITTDPEQWPERDNLTVKVGMSVGERMAKINALDSVIQHQVAAIQGGQNGVLADNKKLYNALIDWARANGLTNPEQYYIDPNTPEAQQAAQQNAQGAQMQNTQLQQMNQQQVQLELEKVRMQEETKRIKIYVDAEVAEAQIVGKATADLELADRVAARAAGASDADTGKPGMGAPGQ